MTDERDDEREHNVLYVICGVYPCFQEPGDYDRVVGWKGRMDLGRMR